MACVIHWFRRDLRLGDNTALNHALLSSDPVLPLFILDDYILERRADADRRRFLSAALDDLDAQLRERGSRLTVRHGDAARELSHVAEEAEPWGVYFNRDYTPYARQRDTRATRGLQLTGVVTQVFDDLLLVSPHSLLSAEGDFPETFDVFRERWLASLDLEPVSESEPLEAVLMEAGAQPESVDGWAEVLEVQGPSVPPAGSTPATAHDMLRRFVADSLAGYAAVEGVAGRADAGSETGVDMLLAALDFGTLSVREAARAVLRRGAADRRARRGAERFIDELARREFAVHMRFADPTAPPASRADQLT